jgi:hypothetical protein
MGPSAAAVAGSAKPKASAATMSRAGRLRGIGSPRSTDDTRAKVPA